MTPNIPALLAQQTPVGLPAPTLALAVVAAFGVLLLGLCCWAAVVCLLARFERWPELLGDSETERARKRTVAHELREFAFDRPRPSSHPPHGSIPVTTVTVWRHQEGRLPVPLNPLGESEPDMRNLA